MRQRFVRQSIDMDGDSLTWHHQTYLAVERNGALLFVGALTRRALLFAVSTP